MTDSPLEQLANRLTALLPPGMGALREELERNIKAVLQQHMDKLDLVSREQFEVSQAMLKKSREKLEALEQRLNEMENR